MPRNAVFATSDGGAVLGENGEIAERCGLRRRASCRSIFCSFGGVRIELDQIAGTVGSENAHNETAGRAGPAA
jgi:hypothetical protein